MKIEEVKADSSRIRIKTTGSIFDIGPAEARVTTRIPREADVGSLQWPEAGAWQIVEESAEEVRLARSNQTITLGSDGFLVLNVESPTQVSFVPAFDPDLFAENKLATDVRGEGFGFGLYRLPGTRFTKTVLKQVADARHPLHFHVFPPRHADPEAFATRISHEGRPQPGKEYPSDDIIREAAQHTGIFALHAYFWHEEDKSLRPKFSRYRFRKCPWRTAHHIPEDELELKRVMKTVKEEGMKFVPYVSPRYSTVGNVLSELDRLMALYDFDGFYLDGLRGNFIDQRNFIRALRQDLGQDKIIYLNGTNQPFNTARITAPFIDTHCDYVLRGDSGRAGLSRDDFLRRCVSGQGAGNQVGVWCHYGSSGFPFPYDRAPSPADQQAASDHHCQIWRRSFW